MYYPEKAERAKWYKQTLRDVLKKQLQTTSKLKVQPEPKGIQKKRLRAYGEYETPGAFPLPTVAEGLRERQKRLGLQLVNVIQGDLLIRAHKWLFGYDYPIPSNPKKEKEALNKMTEKIRLYYPEVYTEIVNLGRDPKLMDYIARMMGFSNVPSTAKWEPYISKIVASMYGVDEFTPREM